LSNEGIKQRVAMLFGQEVADVLNHECLLANDYHYAALTPDRWRVYARGDQPLAQYQPGSGYKTVKWPHSLSKKLHHAYRCALYLTDPKAFASFGQFDYGGWCVAEFKSEATARRQAKMAQNLGLSVRLHPVAAVEMRPVELK
jgi:hypothetical protein